MKWRAVQTFDREGRQEMTLEEIKKQSGGRGRTTEEQISFLRKNRMELLDEIHGKQQLLDQLDYLIHELKEKTP